MLLIVHVFAGRSFCPKPLWAVGPGMLPIKVLAQDWEACQHTLLAAAQENVYPAEYDIPAERGGDADAGSYQDYDAGPSDMGQPGKWSSEAGTGYQPSYLDGRYENRPSERSASRERLGPTWTSRIDVESVDDWD